MKSYDSIENRYPEAGSLLKFVQKVVYSVVPGSQVVLYGSRARGDASPTSDWDFLILVDRPIDRNLLIELKNRLYDVELETETIISSIIRTQEEWDSPRYAGLPFKRIVEQEGVSL